VLKNLIEEPVICETHGGNGAIYRLCYTGIRRGFVFETNEKKAEVLARQRPAWAIWNCDCVKGVSSGVGKNMVVNFLDVDPYGSPWDIFEAWFSSERIRAQKLTIVCNDGLRSKLKVGAWDVKVLGGMVKKYGNNLYHIYLEVAKELMKEKAALAGYSVNRFVGYYCGANQDMTHYTAELVR
jgi:hypothetical protein